MALAIAPLASAQGFGMSGGFHGRGHMNIGDPEIRAELEACKEEHQGDREAMKACADAVFESHGLEHPERPEHEDRPEISEEAHAELEACRDNNEGDHEAAKACADAVFAKYGIEKPDMPMHGMHRGRRMGHQFRSNIKETCGERENTDEWKACAKEARGSAREEMQTRRSSRREQLDACLELDSIDELKQCVRDVRDQ